MKLVLDTIESLKIAWHAITANKARGALTTLGIIIGIVAVTTTMTAFNGMQSSFRQAAGAIGADVVYVSRMPWIIMGDWFLYRNRPNLVLDEAEQLGPGQAEEIDRVTREYPQLSDDDFVRENLDRWLGD